MAVHLKPCLGPRRRRHDHCPRLHARRSPVAVTRRLGRHWCRPLAGAPGRGPPWAWMPRALTGTRCRLVQRSGQCLGHRQQRSQLRRRHFRDGSFSPTTHRQRGSTRALNYATRAVDCMVARSCLGRRCSAFHLFLQQRRDEAIVSCELRRKPRQNNDTSFRYKMCPRCRRSQCGLRRCMLGRFWCHPVARGGDDSHMWSATSRALGG